MLPRVLEELEKYNCKKLIVMADDDLDTIDALKKFDCEILFQNKVMDQH